MNGRFLLKTGTFLFIVYYSWKLPSYGNEIQIEGEGCSRAFSDAQFVYEAPNLANDVHLMETLVCIASGKDTKRAIGERAVETIAALSSDDSVARSYLVRVVLSPTTVLETHSIALELLVLYADDSTRKLLLEELKRTWPDKRWGHYFEFFTALGDTDFLKWLKEEAGSSPGVNISFLFYENFIRRIEIQKEPKLLLEEIASGEDKLYREWYVRTALRIGIDSEEIRVAVMTSLLKPGESETATLKSSDRFFVHRCREFGILSSADAQQLEALGYRDTSVWRSEPKNDPIESRVAQKRAEFYRLPHSK